MESIEDLIDRYGKAKTEADMLKEELSKRMANECIDKAEGNEYTASMTIKTYRDGEPFERQHPAMAMSIKRRLADMARDKVLEKPLPYSAVPERFADEARTTRTDMALTVKKRH